MGSGSDGERLREDAFDPIICRKGRIEKMYPVLHVRFELNCFQGKVYKGPIKRFLYICEI